MSGEIDNKLCTPERPLSDMGALSYKSYWKDAIFTALKTHPPFRKANYDISIREISDFTNIQMDDIMMTL